MSLTVTPWPDDVDSFCFFVWKQVVRDRFQTAHKKVGFSLSLSVHVCVFPCVCWCQISVFHLSFGQISSFTGCTQRLFYSADHWRANLLVPGGPMETVGRALIILCYRHTHRIAGTRSKIEFALSGTRKSILNLNAQEQHTSSLSSKTTVANTLAWSVILVRNNDWFLTRISHANIFLFVV